MLYVNTVIKQKRFETPMDFGIYVHSWDHTDTGGGGEYHLMTKA